jgi:hypothetical protein
MRTIKTYRKVGAFYIASEADLSTSIRIGRTSGPSSNNYCSFAYSALASFRMGLTRESKILAIVPITVYKVHDGRRDYVMSRNKSRVVRFLFYGLACVLICAAFASELPEQLTLTNDTSNDYSFRPSTSLKIQTLNSLRQDSSFFVTTAQQHTLWRSLLSVPGRVSPQAESLFILHSVLRT